MPTITIREATVQTVQIEIKALKVGKKQVTMGLFRQLPLAPLIDPQTIQLHGIPWGHVLYWWDGDGRPTINVSDLLHVVWQDSETLRRAIVTTDPPRSVIINFAREIETWRANFFYRKLLDDRTIRVEVPASEYGVVTANLLYQGKKISLTFAGKEERKILMNFVHAPTNEACLQTYYAFLADRGIAHLSSKECGQNFDTSRKQQEDYFARWRKQIQALQELPQLFIAV